MASSKTLKIANPGYSFKAPRFNFWKLRYEGGGIVWVGTKGGDTPENRKKFVQWVAKNQPDTNVDSLVFLD